MGLRLSAVVGTAPSTTDSAVSACLGSRRDRNCVPLLDRDSSCGYDDYGFDQRVSARSILGLES